MNRLVRIAITFFISASVLALLVRQRLVRLGEQTSEVLPADYIRDEKQMAIIGMIIAGALAVGGITLLVVAFVRRSKRSPRHE